MHALFLKFLNENCGVGMGSQREKRRWQSVYRIRKKMVNERQKYVYNTNMSVSGLYAGGITWSNIVNNIVATLGVTIFFVSVAAFLIGSLMHISGFVSEENKNKGKNLMIGALFGMAVVLSAKAIFNTAYFFVYGN